MTMFRSTNRRKRPGTAAGLSRGLAPFGACGLLIACGQGDPSTDALPPTTRDSAGIEIVESPAPRRPAGAWSVTDEALLCSGDSDLRVHLVRAVVPLEDGAVAVLTHADRKLLVCAGGVVERAFIREGEGPGELRGSPAGGLRARGDSVAIVGQREVVVVSTVDGGARDLGLASLDAADATRFIAALDAPAALASAAGRTEGTSTDPWDVVFLDWAGREVDRLRGVPWTTAMGPSILILPWWPTTNLAFRSDGMVVAAPDTLEIRHIDATGLRRILRTPVDRPVVGEDLLDRLAENVLEGLRGPNPEALEEHVRGLVEQARSEGLRPPAVLEVLPLPTGETWARLARPDPLEDPVRWRIFDPAGAWLTDLDLPRGFRLEAVEADTLYGVRTDDLDLQRVVRYIVRRGR